MRFKILAVGAAIIVGAAFAPNTAGAAALPGASKTTMDSQSMVEVVRRGGHRGHHHGHGHHGHHHHGHHHHRPHFHHHHFRHRPLPYYGGYSGYGYGYGRCTRVRHICADRHGWQTRGFYRCVYRRGC